MLKLQAALAFVCVSLSGVRDDRGRAIVTACGQHDSHSVTSLDETTEPPARYIAILDVWSAVYELAHTSLLNNYRAILQRFFVFLPPITATAKHSV